MGGCCRGSRHLTRGKHTHTCRIPAPKSPLRTWAHCRMLDDIWGPWRFSWTYEERWLQEDPVPEDIIPLAHFLTVRRKLPGDRGTEQGGGAPGPGSIPPASLWFERFITKNRDNCRRVSLRHIRGPRTVASRILGSGPVPDAPPRPPPGLGLCRVRVCRPRRRSQRGPGSTRPAASSLPDSRPTRAGRRSTCACASPTHLPRSPRPSPRDAVGTPTPPLGAASRRGWRWGSGCGERRKDGEESPGARVPGVRCPRERGGGGEPQCPGWGSGEGVVPGPGRRTHPHDVGDPGAQDPGVWVQPAVRRLVDEAAFADRSFSWRKSKEESAGPQDKVLYRCRRSRAESIRWN